MWQTLVKFRKKSNNEQVLSPMASRSGSGSGKRPGYVDLDASNPSGEDPWDLRSVPAALHRSSGSSGSKKPKKGQNPNNIIFIKMGEWLDNDSASFTIEEPWNR